jgi:hypothetical protein
MGGGLMQLVAYGAQDIYLSGNPQITFFKVVYRRHTNFSMESIQQTFNGDVGFDKKVTCTISRNGDLISKMYLEIDLAALPVYYQTNNTTNQFSYQGNIFDGEHKYFTKLYSKPDKTQLDDAGLFYIENNNMPMLITNTNTDVNITAVHGKDISTGEATVFISGFYNDDINSTFIYSQVFIGQQLTEQLTYGHEHFDDNKQYTTIPVDGEEQYVPVYKNDTVQIRAEYDGEIYDVVNQNFTSVQYVEETAENIPFPPQEWIGHKIIDYVEVEIGGQRIDKHYGDWLAIWNELTQTEGHWDGYKQMVEGSKLYIPLQFWFNRNPGLALPLIALQYHEVKLNIKFASKQNTYTNLTTVGIDDRTHVADWSDFDGIGDMQSASLYVDYIYLDTDERRRFAQVSHEYLIEQLQFTGDENVKSKIKLNFNHPVKELIWVEKLGGDQPTGEFATSYTKANIQLNGHDRFSSREPSYFQLVQPYQHHTRIPVNQDISVYSFSLQPEEHQPSGTCNMSRIDNATLYLENAFNGNTIKVFAINYNVLRVMSGMGGLAYSN